MSDTSLSETMENRNIIRDLGTTEGDPESWCDNDCIDISRNLFEANAALHV